MTLSTQSLNFKKDKTLAARHSYSLSAKVNSLFTSLKLTSKQPTNQKAKATSPTIPSFSDAMATKDCTEESPRNSLSHRDSNQQANASYLEASKEKKLYYSPFRWSFDGYLAQYIKTQSLFVLGEASLGQENTFFQIQQNKEKIGKMRDQIELVFQLYYKLMFYNRVRINSSVEINKLKKSMDDVRMVIDTERSYDYENNVENLFVSMNLGEKVYSEYKQILESPIRDIFIPVLSSLKNKYYAQEYLSEEHKEVQTNLETLITGINRTVEVVYLMKKQIDVDTKLSTVTPYDLAKFEKIQNPQQLYAAFVDVVVQIKALSNQANLLPKLRNLFRKYLKLAVILEVYSKGEAKLKELKRRLLTISTRLEKKVEAQSTNMYDLFRRATNEVLPTELPVEECKFDLKTIIDKEECLEYAKVAEMKQHLFAVEGFVRRAEIYCEELASNKNPKKTAQMTENSALYIQQVETTLRGIFYARQKMEEIKSVMEKGSYQEQAKEDIIREVKIETRELAYQVRQSDQAFDLEGWNSSKITAAFHHALDNEYVVKKKWKKGSQKAVHFGKKKMMEKLAEIVRKRRHEKNKIFVSCKTRIESSLNIGDILRFFKSKRQWQAIASPKSHMVLIRDGGVLKEPIFRRIYCNSELESYILKIVRSFVNALAEPEHKSLP